MPIPQTRVAELLYVVLKALQKRGGPASARDLFNEVRPRLQLTDEELTTVSSGEPRWSNLVRWYSVDAVKSGYLAKENGLWQLTSSGLEALNMPQEEFFRAVRQGYREWERSRQKTDEPSTDDLPEEVSVTQTAIFQDATERAAQEIVRHIESLDPYTFQELVGEVMRAMGYHVREIAPRGPDGGIDLVVYPDPLGTKDPRLIIQVKHRNEKTSAKEIRELAGILRADGDMGIFVSRSGFTSEAVREAGMANKRIELMALDRLITLAIENYSHMHERGRRILPLEPVYFLTPDE